MANTKKSFDDQVREKYKNLKQRAVSGKKSTNTSQLNNSSGGAASGSTLPPGSNSSLPIQQQS